VQVFFFGTGAETEKKLAASSLGKKTPSQPPITNPQITNPQTTKQKELEKLKFVLDFRLRELKRAAEPREAEAERAKQVCVCVCIGGCVVVV
jgi:hypothetical protein